MRNKEIVQLLIAVLVLFVITGFGAVVALDAQAIGIAIAFSVIIILVSVGGRKMMGRYLDADVEHEIWRFYRHGFAPHAHYKKPVPMGIILPLVITAFTTGFVKWMTILTFDTKALKRRAARRHGKYSFTEMTDWHVSLISAAGIAATLALSFITYWIPFLEPLARLAAFYAFFNMIPFSKLDGAQIFYGSRVLWSILAVITVIFTIYALLLV